MALTQDQIDFFSANGYLPIGKILEDDEIELFRGEYDREFALARDNDSYRNIAVSDSVSREEKRSSPVQMLQITQMSERNIHFMRLLYDARILDIVSELMGPNIMLFHDQALFKPAKTGGPVLWHQDNAYWRCRPANLISCWMTFDDAVKENGAMQMIPGSHLKPIWHETAESTDALLDTGAHVDESQAVTVDLPAGGIMFHHCQTLHYTQPNMTDRQRRAFAIHFMPPGTRHGDGKVIGVGFSHPMLKVVA
jgi:phytanoyl-CoA hydroxylase